MIRCAGFRPVLAHLARLVMFELDSRVQGTQAVRKRRLWTVGYGT